MADSQGLVKTSKNRQSIESSSFIYGEVHDIIASGYTSSPVEKEKQNYEATAPGNPRFLEQPIQINSALIRSDHERSIKTLISSGVDNSMAKKKKILKRFGSLLRKFRLFSTGIEQG